LKVIKKPQHLGLIRVLLILLLFFPIEISLNNISSNVGSNGPPTSAQWDIVDYIDFHHRSTYGGTMNFIYMAQNNDNYATLFESRPVPRYPLYSLEQIYRFENVNYGYGVSELHIELQNQPKEILYVFVGSVPNAINKVGDISKEGDNSFNVGPFLDSSVFFVRITDSSYANSGPYNIKRMYLLLAEPNIPPSVNAGTDQNVNEGDIVSFTGSFLDPDESDTHTIEWDFGDGSTATDSLTPTHIYRDDGEYTVTLTVIDSNGGIGTDSLVVTINNLAPIVDAGSDQVVTENELVYFHGDFSDMGSLDTHTVYWSFGDGTAATGTLTPTHLYRDNGIYTALLTVTDDDDGVSSDSLIITVNNVAPIVSATNDQYTQEGSEISLVLVSFTDQGVFDTHTAIIDWGDGVIEPGVVTEPGGPMMMLMMARGESSSDGTVSGSHIYGDNDIYTVVINVTDNDGGVGTDTLLITVSNIAPTVTVGDDQIVDEGDIVSFNGNFFDSGGLDIHTIEWDFGDGSTTSNTLTPTHIYGDNGIYIVSLIVSDDDGGVGSDTLVITVNNVAPIVQSGGDQSVDEGEIIGFSGSVSDPGSLDTHTIEWDFGDGVI